MPDPRRTRLAIAPVVLMMTIAFALGSVGTASAGGLTKGAVKKIAAKVVRQQAPSLSVKHSVTADSATVAANADKVGGLTVDQLGGRSYVLTLPKVQTFNNVANFSLASVPAGSYLVTFDAVFFTSATVAECQIHNSTTGDYPFDIYVTAATGHVPALSGAGFFTKEAGDVVQFSCGMTGSWSAAYPAELTFTPVPRVVASNLTASTRAAAGSGSSTAR